MDFAFEKPDIRDREDLERLIKHFYQKLLLDPEIGHFFNEVVHLDLAHHVPKIASFWEMALFQTGNYQGDPMAVHMRLHGMSEMKASHFEVWLRHFRESVDELFAGNMAELAKQRAYSIAMLIQVKINRQPMV